MLNLMQAALLVSMLTGDLITDHCLANYSNVRIPVPYPTQRSTVVVAVVG